MTHPSTPVVEIYTGPNCHFCAQAKDLLHTKGVMYKEHDISSPSGLNAMRQRLPQARTIPQIFIANEYIGGFEDLHQLVSQGKLDPMLGRDNP